MLITAGLSFIDSQILRPDGTIRSSSLSSSENLLWFFPNNGCPCDAIRTYQHSIPGFMFQLSLCTVQPAYQLHEASFQLQTAEALSNYHLPPAILLAQRKQVGTKGDKREIGLFREKKKPPKQFSEKSHIPFLPFLLQHKLKFKAQT